MANTLEIKFINKVHLNFHRGHRIFASVLSANNLYLLVREDSLSYQRGKLYHFSIKEGKIEQRPGISLNYGNFISATIHSIDDTTIQIIGSYREPEAGAFMNRLNEPPEEIIVKTTYNLSDGRRLTEEILQAFPEVNVENTVVEPRLNNFSLYQNSPGIQLVLSKQIENSHDGVVVYSLLYPENNNVQGFSLPPFYISQPRHITSQILIASFVQANEPLLFIKTITGGDILYDGEELELERFNLNKTNYSLSFQSANIDFKANVIYLDFYKSISSNKPEYTIKSNFNFENEQFDFPLLNRIKSGEYFLRLRSKSAANFNVTSDFFKIRIKNEFYNLYTIKKKEMIASSLLLIIMICLIAFIALIAFVPALKDYQFNFLSFIVYNESYGGLFGRIISYLITGGLLAFTYKNVLDHFKQTLLFLNN